MALPIELRWCTPAADLYRRRLRAQVAGEAEENLPTEMRRVEAPPPTPRHSAEPQPPIDEPPTASDAGQVCRIS